MKRQVEIFTANCPVCEPVVAMVSELSCGECDITVYNLAAQRDDKTLIGKLAEYRITKVPAVVVNGSLLGCCQDQGVSRDELVRAGIGQRG
ncbi:MAG: thioredoxin family protein [Ignavibacteria bacterium]|nr:thioredoxin family protein [Ignavibacteria bacterium]